MKSLECILSEFDEKYVSKFPPNIEELNFWDGVGGYTVKPEELRNFITLAYQSGEANGKRMGVEEALKADGFKLTVETYEDTIKSLLKD